ncbi:serine acetyltransferase [Bradyrhizobium manausense]|nr:serine acetyltransferase [Bradyrhizobium manausense]
MTKFTSDAGVSATEPDWSREKVTSFWEPGKQLLKTIRGYQHCAARSGPAAALRRKLYVLEHRFWSVVTGADIPINCRIGGGLAIPHPNGIVIHPQAHVGVNCLIFQQVTLGTRRGGGVPVLEGHVDVGAGAKIFGEVVIPAHSEVRANSVVTSWPPGSRTPKPSSGESSS